jgi:hypothetical protein
MRSADGIWLSLRSSRRISDRRDDAKFSKVSPDPQLGEIYGFFNEGFDTTDLVRARAKLKYA